MNKNGQYGAEPFEQQQFGTAGVEGVNCNTRAMPQNEKFLKYYHSTFIQMLKRV